MTTSKDEGQLSKLLESRTSICMSANFMLPCMTSVGNFLILIKCQCVTPSLSSVLVRYHMNHFGGDPLVMVLYYNIGSAFVYLYACYMPSL